MVKLGMSKADPLMMVAKNNIRFEVPRRLHHEFKEIFLENAYSIGMQKKINENPTIIDIGANVGFFTMFAMSKYPDCTLYAFEPVKANFEQLMQNRNLNKDKDIFCFNKAVCGHKGTITLNFDTSNSFTTSASILAQGKDTEGVEVPCLSLADLFTENSIDFCDLLKLDCEGSEYDVLYNSPKDILNKIDQMAIEVHQGRGENENLASLRTFLEKQGYSLLQFKDKQHMLWAYRKP